MLFLSAHSQPLFAKRIFLEEADELTNNHPTNLASQHRPINLNNVPYSYSIKLVQARFLASLESGYKLIELMIVAKLTVKQ